MDPSDPSTANGTSAPNDAHLRTTVHLVRHGEVENPERILYGRLPGYGLSDLGKRMAEAVARALADADVTHVIASPLLRAQQTAAPIAASHHLAVEVDPRLLEAGNDFEGKRLAGARARDLATLDSLRRIYNPFRPSWGEPFAEQRDRMFAAIAYALREARGHEAVLVSHQSPIWAVRRALQGKPLWHDPRSRECTLASVTSLTFVGSTLVSHAYSEPAASLLPQASAVAGA